MHFRWWRAITDRIALSNVVQLRMACILAFIANTFESDYDTAQSDLDYFLKRLLSLIFKSLNAT
jgi:hypothetical protein